ncbi:TetR/AcrR family transcriptional regulator [Streptomyces sp. CA-210063]|uniref:TetR/AcrR family transcriptional regulator n=1 Tax=Streptomyces sp. CA-210063 TaxID=2801029 RepID=UPI00214B4AD3|nr:TetR/AcrR family transcriptional regulator [Streptomyces sp. CA-210063]UUU32345.1 TetR/AcrR family transcriptional regulator [Streptomyces sp. CA-210063]
MSNSEYPDPVPSDPVPSELVPSELVQAALRVARAREAAVADVPLQAIAREAGISRSTLLRRLGGGRRALDDAVRAAGVDPGGQKPVRERAIEAGAALISGHGLASLSLERVASSAQCSVHSLYAAFGGREEMLQAIFLRYSPMVDVEAVVATQPADLDSTVRKIYALMATAIGREPRVMPAILAELLARPQDESLQPLVQYIYPRLFAGVGKWLTAEIAAGRIRDLPPLLLLQQMSSPLVMHLLLRPATRQVPDLPSPSIEEVCDTFADAFLRAVALPAP